MRRALFLALAVLLLSSGQIAADQAIIDRLNPGAYARVDHAGALVVTSTGSVVNIAHISAALHIAGFVPVWAYQSGIWTLAAVHQAGVWNVAHLSAVAHVSLGTQAVYVTQSGAWTIQAAHLAGVPSISQGTQWSVLAHAQQSGSWTVQATHQGGEWNTRHVGTVLHVVVVDWQRWAHIQSSQSGSWTIQAAHQGGTPWTVAHVSSVVHVSGSVAIRDRSNPTLTAVVTHAGELSVTVVGTTATSPCSSKVAVSQTASAQLVAGASGQRIYICSVILITAADQAISLVEGTGSVCATGIAAVMGGTAASMALVANGGLSSVAAFPWLSTATAANALCLLQSGIGNVSGVITYRQS